MSNWFEGDVKANGVKVHYHRTGTHGKPVLLLLHGITDSGRVWQRVAGDLEGEYDIVTTDARGHGQSDDLSSGFSTPILADDAAGVIQALGIQKPYVWGHSMGAITAAALAADHPDLVRAAVLEDPPLPATPSGTPDAPGGVDDAVDTSSPGEGAAVREEEAAKRSSSFPDFAAMSEQERLAAAAAMNPKWHADELPPWAESKTQFDPAIGNYFYSFQSYPWRDVLARIECPILLVTGDAEAGAIVTPEIAEEAVGLLSKGQVVWIAGSGHNIHREGYQQTMQAVKEFLQAN